MDTLYFLKAERHQELDVGSGICIVGQFVVVVIAVMVVAESQRLMPFQTGFLPNLEPVELSARFYEELHFHLLELAHTEDELARNDFVTESLTDLCDAERNLHTSCLLHVQIVHKNTLSRFRTEVNLHRTFRSGTHFGSEHQVELADFRPVLRTADRANDFFVQDYLAKFFKIVVVQRFGKTFVQSVALGLMLQYAGVRAAELCFIESLTETLGGLRHFLVYLVVILGELVFNQYIGTITLLRVAVINQGVVERIHVSACFPDCRVHKDSRVDAYDVFVQQHHALPPVLFDVIFQFHTHLTVIVYGSVRHRCRWKGTRIRIPCSVIRVS